MIDLSLDTNLAQVCAHLLSFLVKMHMVRSFKRDHEAASMRLVFQEVAKRDLLIFNKHPFAISIPIYVPLALVPSLNLLVLRPLFELPPFAVNKFYRLLNPFEVSNFFERF